ncbi:MAG: ATP-NAD kinase family protein [Acidilobaceae archaeon]
MSEEKIIGFLVNPIAGIGGRLGFKGSDGVYGLKALMLGAPLVAPERARVFLRYLPRGPRIITPPGKMGFEWVRGSNHETNTSIVECVSEKIWPTTPLDTIRCARVMAESVSILVFVGGDGTARDIEKGVGLRAPVLGVPSGVKVYSGVFAINPKVAATIAWKFLYEGALLTEREVLDIDEDEYRAGRLKLKLHGYLKTPVVEGLVEGSKSAFSYDEEENLEAIAEYIVENMEDNTLYILGPGRTIEKIALKLGLKKTPLGVDAVYNRRIVGLDLDEKRLVELVKSYPKAKIIISPIGGQGFLLGRGNQQISPDVLRLVGLDNIIIVSSKSKLRSFKTLKVDTGDDYVDNAVRARGYFRVITGYNEEAVVRVE